MAFCHYIPAVLGGVVLDRPDPVLDGVVLDRPDPVLDGVVLGRPVLVCVVLDGTVLGRPVDEEEPVTRTSASEVKVYT